MSKNVQFGCGENRIPNWDNWDTDCDITKLPLPYADNSVDMVLCEHITEHVDLADCVRFLEDCRRILKPGGTMRLIMPVLNQLSPEHARDMAMGHGHKTIWTPELIAMLLRLCGFPENEIRLTGRREGIDGHYKVIGEKKDNQESARLEATK